jgi:predicted DNA-binding transcriptional regulator AlpA
MSGPDPKKTPEGAQSNAIDTKEKASPTHLLSREEIQKEYGLTRRWLELAALTGNGPPFIKIGARTVRYRRDDLERWLAEREVQSTSQYDQLTKPADYPRKKSRGPNARDFGKAASCPGAIAIENHLKSLSEETSND